MQAQRVGREGERQNADRLLVKPSLGSEHFKMLDMSISGYPIIHSHPSMPDLGR